MMMIFHGDDCVATPHRFLIHIVKIDKKITQNISSQKHSHINSYFCRDEIGNEGFSFDNITIL